MSQTEFLSAFDCVMKHRPGKSYGNADGLSRRPDREIESNNGASVERTSNVESEKLVMSVQKDREDSTDESTD